MLGIKKKKEKNRRKGKSRIVLQSTTSGSLKHLSCLSQKICIVFLLDAFSTRQLCSENVSIMKMEKLPANAIAYDFARTFTDKTKEKETKTNQNK